MFDVRGGIGRAETSLTVGIRDLVITQVEDNIVLMTTSGATGGLSSYLLREDQTARATDSQYFTSGQASVAGSVLDVINTRDGLVLEYGAVAGVVYGYTVTGQGDLVSTVETQSAGSAALSLAGMAQTTMGQAYVAGGDGAMIYGLQQAANGQWQQNAQLNMRSHGVSNAVALETVSMGSTEYFLVLCQGGDAVTSFVANPSGALRYAATLGSGQGLGILDAPTGLDVVQAHGRTYVLITSASGTGQAGAISVMQIAADGSLEPTDHILDSLSTRFAGAHSLAVVQSGDQVFVLAAGADDGISLFSLMPGGRLVYLESLSANDEASLSSLSGLAAYQVGDEIQIFTTSHQTAGLTQLTVSLLGRSETFVAPSGGGQVTGGAGHDVISGNGGDDTLSGGGGDDILWDGKGADRLSGGAGADLFVLAWDGETDRITDFNPNQDRLDLSHYRMFYDPSELTIRSTGTGARVEWRGEVLQIVSHNGTSLSQEQVLAAVALGPDRPPLVIDTIVTGTVHANTLAGSWGADSLVGYAGEDTLNGGGGDDRLIGGGQADRLFGESGDDTVLGGNGNDFVALGTGNDVFEDNAQGGLYGRDTVYGGAGEDTIRGGGGNDLFYGELDSDVIRGGSGNDTLWGGAGGGPALWRNRHRPVVWRRRERHAVWQWWHRYVARRSWTGCARRRNRR